MSDLPAQQESAAVRIRRAKLAKARLRLEYQEWWARFVGEFPGTPMPKEIRDAVLSYGLAKQDVFIAEARLEDAIAASEQ